MAAESSTSPQAPRPQLPPVGVALSLLLESASHRVELAVLELDEARLHATRSLLLAVLSTILVLLAGFALTLLAAALVWDSPYRDRWLTGLTLLYLAGAAATSWTLVRRLRTWQPLAETHHQLSQDCRCLRQLLSHQ